jgi:hypothetical protein
MPLKRLWSWVSARGPHVVLGGGLILAVPEVVWLLRAGYAFNPSRASVLLVNCWVAVFVVAVICRALYALAVRISPRWAPLLVVLPLLPLIFFASQSLFSGAAIRQVSAVMYLRVGFALVLTATVAGAAYALPKIFRLGARRAVVGWVIAFLFATVASSYADSHWLVALYPALHYLLAAAAIGFALASARMFLPPGSPGPALRAASSAIALAAALSLGTSWNTPAARHLVAYSNGVAPKVRRLGAALLAPRL